MNGQMAAKGNQYDIVMKGTIRPLPTEHAQRVQPKACTLFFFHTGIADNLLKKKEACFSMRPCDYDLVYVI